MTDLKWWQRAVFYQIYPRSFADGNGDGIGDFPGIIARLDHLRDLGIDAIWLSPHYPSPFLDCGYDISDYTGVAPEYGTLDDFRAFLAAAHARNIRVVIDVVLNHSSDQHPWFVESRSSRDNPKRDWYIWRDGVCTGGELRPPNNWVSIFGGSAWEYDASTGQYYYHAFLRQQPDLNWRSPALKQAMWEAVRFWLDLGVDGLRLDAIGTIYEHPDLPNHTYPRAPEEIVDVNLLPADEYDEVLRYQLRQPGLHELLQELRVLVDEYPGDRVLIGEDEEVAFHGTGDDELHLVFNFPLMRVRRLSPAHVRANQAVRLAELPAGAWPCNTLGNHDGRRVWSRYGDGVHDAALARLHLALLLTLKGTPFLYYGEEIGMTDLELSRLDQLRDTSMLHQYRLMTEEMGRSPQEALAHVLLNTRDRCRSPMQWSDAPQAGFCPPGVRPWLPVNPDYAAGVNVVAQEHDPQSLLAYYRRLLHLRRVTPALVAGHYTPLAADNPDVLAYVRRDANTGQSCAVVLNFSAEPRPLLPDVDLAGAKMLFAEPGVQSGPASASGEWRLLPFAVVILELAPQESQA